MISILGCGTSVKHYAGSGPELKLEQFFNGRLTAYGMVQDRNGKVLRRFRVDMLGTWENGKGKLDEQFTYDDGQQEQRIWHLEKTADGRYTGHADDVVVPARGETGGYALNWHYQLSIPVDGENWAISFNDWMYLIDENRMINRAEMSKWGFKVGEVTLWIEKHS
jgi:hypothetical protein